MKTFKLTDKQKNEINMLIAQRNNADNALVKLISFIVDSKGDTVLENGNWEFTEKSELLVDVVPFSKKVAEQLKKIDFSKKVERVKAKK